MRRNMTLPHPDRGPLLASRTSARCVAGNSWPAAVGILLPRGRAPEDRVAGRVHCSSAMEGTVWGRGGARESMWVAGRHLPRQRTAGQDAGRQPRPPPAAAGLCPNCPSPLIPSCTTAPPAPSRTTAPLAASCTGLPPLPPPAARLSGLSGLSADTQANIEQTEGP